jgi:hypothetical protein
VANAFRARPDVNFDLAGTAYRLKFTLAAACELEKHFGKSSLSQDFWQNHESTFDNTAILFHSLLFDSKATLVEVKAALLKNQNKTLEIQAAIRQTISAAFLPADASALPAERVNDDLDLLEIFAAGVLRYGLSPETFWSLTPGQFAAIGKEYQIMRGAAERDDISQVQDQEAMMRAWDSHVRISLEQH